MKMSRVRYLFVAGWVVGTLLVSGCDAPADDSPQSLPLQPPMATPTVDLDHARKEFDSGGELTGQEMVALKLAIVGDFPSLSSFSGDTDKYLEARDAYFARDKVFTEKLTKCKLKETYGWVGQRWNEKNNAYKHLLVVYIDNPYDGFGKDAAQHHDG